MAAFDPATIRLLREQLRETEAQHKRDLDRLRKFKATSRDSRAVALRERIGTAVAIMRDLGPLLPPESDATAPVELDARAQWLADSRAVLDLLETNPALPLPRFSLAAHASTGSDDADHEFVDAAAAVLGIEPVTSPYASHYSVTVVIGRAEYEVVSVPSLALLRHHEINRLGRAALAALDEAEVA